jgi:hypothetical protein
MLVDSHVHIHSCYQLDDLLDGALANFARAHSVDRNDGRDAQRPYGCLMLTETRHDRVFAALAEGDAAWRPTRWSIRATGDAAALLCTSPHGASVLLIAGSQIVTSEKLEVLALAAATRYPDGESLADVLAMLARDDVPAVIPWGFGKWLMKRRRVLLDAINRSRPADLFLGDNGGRPRLTRQPAVLRDAERRGFRVLPGTDPFPFRSQQRKAGSCGFILPEWEVDEHPAQQMRARLRGLRTSPEAYGRRAGLVEFAWLQVAINIKNRLQRSA